MDELYYEGWDAIERAWREGLTPDPLLTVSEWADKHRVLSSKAASEPGRWRTSRTPYLREIMDCLSPMSPIERVVFMKGAQVGGTELPDSPIHRIHGTTSMSLQTDLHQAVAQVTADSALLHTIVHGTAAQTVTTEGGAVATVAKLLADADARINLAADGLLAQSQAAAQDALTSAELAASEADRAQASADQGVADTIAVLNQVQSSGNQILVDAEAVLQQVIARLLAVGLPDSLIGARGMLLKVKVDESGYELVHTAALPRFYGFALSSDGSELLLTEGRDANFNAQDYLTWTLAEGVTFALHQNALEVQL